MTRADYYMLAGAVYLAPHLWTGVGLALAFLSLVCAYYAGKRGS